MRRVSDRTLLGWIGFFAVLNYFLGSKVLLHGGSEAELLRRLRGA